MISKLQELQDLNVVLSDYAEIVTDNALKAPESRQALLRVYWLQIQVAKAIHSLLESGAPIGPLPPLAAANTHAALRELKAAVRNSRQKPYANISESLINPVLTDNFERLYTILGPNHFPDDDDYPPAPPPVNKRS